MYIGVHTPADVLASIFVAVALILLFKPLVYAEKRNNLPALLVGMLLLAIGYMCFVSFYPFPADTDAHNLESGVKNAYTLLGALLGMIAVYIVDEKWLNFSTKAVWWAQILKVVGGLLVVLAVKSGLKTPLNAIFGESVGRSARYFLVVVVAGVLWPLTFKWFSKLGKKEQ